MNIYEKIKIEKTKRILANLCFRINKITLFYLSLAVCVHAYGNNNITSFLIPLSYAIFYKIYKKNNNNNNKIKNESRLFIIHEKKRLFRKYKNAKKILKDYNAKAINSSIYFSKKKMYNKDKSTPLYFLYSEKENKIIIKTNEDCFINYNKNISSFLGECTGKEEDLEVFFPVKKNIFKSKNIFNIKLTKDNKISDILYKIEKNYIKKMLLYPLISFIIATLIFIKTNIIIYLLIMYIFLKITDFIIAPIEKRKKENTRNEKTKKILKNLFGKKIDLKDYIASYPLVENKEKREFEKSIYYHSDSEIHFKLKDKSNIHKNVFFISKIKINEDLNVVEFDLSYKNIEIDKEKYKKLLKEMSMDQKDILNEDNLSFYELNYLF